MSPDAASVYSLPNEGIVGETGSVIPVDLAGHKVLYPAARENLRKRGGIAEDIGKPEGIALVTQHFSCGPLAHKELAYQGLPA
jgi:hypothetical protein